MIIGITGGIASGKNTLTNILSDIADVIVDADKIAHEVFLQNQYKILSFFQVKNKSQLSNLVFNNQTKMYKLESLVEHKIRRKIIYYLNPYLNNKNKIAILNHPTLFHYRLELFCNLLVGIKASKETVIQRLIEKRNIPYKKALSMYEHQIQRNQSIDLQRNHFDIIIENNNDLVSLKKQSEIIMQIIGDYND